MAAVRVGVTEQDSVEDGGFRVRCWIFRSGGIMFRRQHGLLADMSR